MTQNKEIFKIRRQNFLKKLKNNSVTIIPANIYQIKNRNINFNFRQGNNFYYLTEFPEPDAILVLIKSDNIDNLGIGQSLLFCNPKNPIIEQWEGEICGSHNAKTNYGFDAAFDLGDFENKLTNILKNNDNLYYSIGQNHKLDCKIIKTLNKLKYKDRSGITVPDNILSYENILGEMRLIKSDFEINQMQKAADISVLGHIKAMQSVKHCKSEQQLYAELIREFYFNGAGGEAYPAIVASHKNACILHYTDNNQSLVKDSLVLIDAGCEYNNYASDITRTFPVSGKFNQNQLYIYQLVLDAQLAGIEQIYPGNSWINAQKAIVEVLVTGLVKLGILNGKISKLIEQELYKPYYMHSSGHFLGLDTHDVGAYKVENKWRKLEAGMVLTVEPGLYLSDYIKSLDSKWHNIGVRIEDDILVTEKGWKVLSNNLPKQVEDIYNLM